MGFMPELERVLQKNNDKLMKNTFDAPKMIELLQRPFYDEITPTRKPIRVGDTFISVFNNVFGGYNAKNGNMNETDIIAIDKCVERDNRGKKLAKIVGKSYHRQLTGYFSEEIYSKMSIIVDRLYQDGVQNGFSSMQMFQDSLRDLYCETINFCNKLKNNVPVKKHKKTMSLDLLINYDGITYLTEIKSKGHLQDDISKGDFIRILKYWYLLNYTNIMQGKDTSFEDYRILIVMHNCTHHTMNKCFYYPLFNEEEHELGGVIDFNTFLRVFYDVESKEFFDIKREIAKDNDERFIWGLVAFIGEYVKRKNPEYIHRITDYLSNIENEMKKK